MPPSKRQWMALRETAGISAETLTTFDPFQNRISPPTMAHMSSAELATRLIRERDRLEIVFAAKEGRDVAAWVRWELLHETEQS